MTVTRSVDIVDGERDRWQLVDYSCRRHPPRACSHSLYHGLRDNF